jgi:hypothetical protein
MQTTAVIVGCNESYKMQQNLTCQDGNCACVICTFMLDNWVHSVEYNGVPLGISPGSAVTSWNLEKVISFQSCCDNCPGVLEIKGKYNTLPVEMFGLIPVFST